MNEPFSEHDLVVPTGAHRGGSAPSPGTSPPIRELRARERIARLADRGTPSDADTKEVERLGLRYRLLTERTSFVVVDPTVRNKGGARDVAQQPSVALRGVTLDFSQVTISGEASYMQSRKMTSTGSMIQGIIGDGPRMGIGGLGSAGYGSGAGATRIVPGKIIYEGGMSRESLDGKLVLSWVIKGDGKVDKTAIVSSTLAGPRAVDVGTCAVTIVSRLQFPAPKGGGVVKVTYPFVFSQNE